MNFGTAYFRITISEICLSDSNVSGFIAQLIKASHRYREVTGSNPVEVLNFSGQSA